MKVEFFSMPCVSLEIIEQHRSAALARNLPPHTEFKATARRLAVVGSGPSVAARLEEIRSFDGDVWGINGAARWLNERGIDATLVSVCTGTNWDPIEHYTAGIKRAILSWSCAPAIFDALSGAEVFLAKVNTEGVEGGSSTATAIPMIALSMGAYQEAVFFGCESCFSERTHVDRIETISDAMVVTCNGGQYITNPQMMIQAKELSKILREFPTIFKDASGGLLSAMIADPRWELTHATPALQRTLKLVA